jgi:hypothetical protein
MSIKIMVNVWELSEHNGLRLLLLLAIADYADENGLAWPGTRTLAHKIRMDRRNMWRTVQEVADSGELLVLNRERQRSNMSVVIPGLTKDQFNAALKRARSMGAVSVLGTDDWEIPEQVLKVLGGGVTGTPPKKGGGVTETPQVACEVASQARHPGVTETPDPSLTVNTDPSEDPSGSASLLWSDTILPEIRTYFPKGTYEGYFRGSELVAADNGTWTVQVRDPLVAEFIDKRLRPMVEKRVETHAPGVRVEFVAREGAA